MSIHERPLVGSVFERTTPRTPSAPSSRFTGTPGTGFPVVQHRFKSAFARARDEVDVTGSRRMHGPPFVSKLPQTRPSGPPAAPNVDAKPIPTDTDALLRQIDQDNARTISHMSEDEIEQEKRAILEQLGEGTEQRLRRVKEARLRREAKERETRALGGDVVSEAQEGGNSDTRQTTEHDRDQRVPLVASPASRRVSDGLATRPGVLRVKSLENIARAGECHVIIGDLFSHSQPKPSAPSPLPATSSTRPSSRIGRKLRFAEVTPDDIHVYESAPRSPKRSAFALPPPPDMKDDSIVSLGMIHKDAVPSKPSHSTDNPSEEESTRSHKDDELEEGTPEYIRRRYFPNIPADDTNLAWMAPSKEMADTSVPRFDLHGVPIPASLSASLPSHLGLHHHAEGSRAGYTIDDVFLLARSTVPAQRASMLGVLAKIAHRLGQQMRHPDGQDDSTVFAGREGEFRKRILATGLAAIDQIGSLGAQAIEVVWECLVEWDGPTTEIGGVELDFAPDVISSLQLDYVLPQIADVISHAALPSNSLAQLLAVVHWLAQQSNSVADMIIATPRLVPTILDTFLLTSIPPRDASVPPNPLALQLLITLASASRSNASALLDPADALLRFVTLLPPSSPYPPVLATTLLTYTLRFYTTLASYGLYSHIATSASQIFTNLASYIYSNTTFPRETADVSDLESKQLRIAWASLVESWTVCATNPHATSPPHEILWSQVCAWGWATDVRKLGEGLGDEISNWPLFAAIWDAESAWLEGARINGTKGGEGEREEALQTLMGTFASDGGTEFGIVRCALEAVQRDLGRGCSTTAHDGERILRSLAHAGTVLASALRLWLACLPPLGDGASLSTPPFALPLSELSALSATLVKHQICSLPSTPRAAHLRVHLRPLTRFVGYFHRVSQHIPGTTPQLWFAQALVFLSCLLPGDEFHALAMVDAFSLVTPQFVAVDTADLPQNIHVDVLRPFFEYTVRPEGRWYVAPLRPNTESISRSSTLRLPSLSQSPGSSNTDDASEDPKRTFTAGLALTSDFLFTPLTHLLRSGTSPVFRALPDNWTPSEVEVVRATLLLAYATRRVLIAHGLEGFVQSAAQVVFACMRVCMLEHGVGTGGTGEVEVFRDAGVERLMTLLLAPFTVRGRTDGGPRDSGTLEDASAPYLGVTPFYQFYTDLVALYGAVSFGHPTFAALILTPLAMHYPVDYRRAFWCGGDGVRSGSATAGEGGAAGLGDVVRSVRVPIEDVICTVGDLREYLYPIERDVVVLGAYVSALVSREGGGDGVDGFLRLVTVHHVACVVWGDMEEGTGEHAHVRVEAEGEVTRREAVRARLLKAVLTRGGADVVRDVVLYRQHAAGTFVWPPTCYRGGEDEDARTSGWREERLAFIARTMGASASARVEALLMGTV